MWRSVSLGSQAFRVIVCPVRGSRRSGQVQVTTALSPTLGAATPSFTARAATTTSQPEAKEISWQMEDRGRDRQRCGSARQGIGLGGSGNDIVYFRTGLGADATLDGRNGDDPVVSEAAGGTTGGGKGDDIIVIHGAVPPHFAGDGFTISGVAGADTIIGNDFADTNDGGDGRDYIDVLEGDADRVTCGPGTDVVRYDASDTIAADCDSSRPNAVARPAARFSATTVGPGVVGVDGRWPARPLLGSTSASGVVRCCGASTCCLRLLGRRHRRRSCSNVRSSAQAECRECRSDRRVVLRARASGSLPRLRHGHIRAALGAAGTLLQGWVLHLRSIGARTRGGRAPPEQEDVVNDTPAFNHRFASTAARRRSFSITRSAPSSPRYCVTSSR